MHLTATDAAPAALAARLQEARTGRRTIAKLTSQQPDFDIEQAYAVQRAGMELRLLAGESIIGGKLGFTSRAMQQAMGVDAPNYGWLTDAMVIHDRTVRLRSLIHPKVEPEIAFVLAADLGPDTTHADVLVATAAVVPCLEVVDSRYDGFQFTGPDNIADNSSAGMLVLGEAAVAPVEVDLRTCGVVLRVGGEVKHTAAGAAALDDPAAAVAWMARTVAATARQLRAGDIVISGGLTAPVDLAAGMVVDVEIDRIGSAQLRVAEE